MQQQQQICSYKKLQETATTVRLFDGTIWVNMNHGKFLNSRTGEQQSIMRLYPKVRTAVTPGGVVFAKRKHPKADLYCVKKFKAKMLL